ncbi:uncharacterized protein BCR38DRAFT_170857 [Pseudomassariella vexata]|uniref:F-box domain-containing protein n=1 Tax=Pseudomassariella vexata TaxID=1141098 RepID=A0A1Y2E359_9PEZI|nr:uncharacterized protein BCR38DRAFT_170857 [Pseudomassariella vexata]ORY65991.1 hypothetical protein BCR38DRAFT_170857 [Pseudomassariella vexata]
MDASTEIPPFPLFHLPTEIVLEIVEKLAPPPPSLTDRDAIFGRPGECSLANPIWFQYDAWPSSHAISESGVLFSTLSALCRTCHHLNDVARPFLYRSIIFGRGKRMVLLFRTLIENPDLALLISKLFFVSTMADQKTVANIRQYWRRYIESEYDQDERMGRTSRVNVQRLSPTSMSTLLWADFIFWSAENKPRICLPFDMTRISSVILSLTKRADTVLARLPLRSDGQWSRVKAPVHGLWYFNDQARSDWRPDLSSVVTLQLKSDCDLGEWYDQQLYISLASFPNLKTLELCLDRSNLLFEEHSDFSRIENLRLIHAVVSSGFMANLVQRCSGLQTLYINCVPSYTDQILESTSNESDLSQALHYTPELRSLHIQYTQDWRLGTYGREKLGDRFENDVRAGSFSHLTKLEYLTVETMALWGSHPSFCRTHSQRRLANFLPKSLVRLELLEVWYDPTEAELDSFTVADRCRSFTDMLQDLANDHTRLPNLREVVVQTNWSDCDSLVEESSYFDGFVRDSQQILQAVGIDFNAKSRSEDVLLPRRASKRRS